MSRSKPIGLVLIGAMILGFAGLSALIAVLLAVGNVPIGGGHAVIFDIPQPLWILLLGAAAGLLAAYAAAKIGLGLLREPGVDRAVGELAMWFGIPIVWLALAAINLLLTEGQDDVNFFWGLIAPAGVFWSAVLVAAGLYMRSEIVRSYFQR